MCTAEKRILRVWEAEVRSGKATASSRPSRMAHSNFGARRRGRETPTREKERLEQKNEQKGTVTAASLPYPSSTRSLTHATPVGVLSGFAGFRGCLGDVTALAVSGGNGNGPPSGGGGGRNGSSSCACVKL